MSNFTKLLGLAAVATAFAGLSYGQVIVSPCTSVAAAAGEPANPSLRAEGETELLEDIVITCNVSAATSGTLVINVSPLVVTSKSIPVPGAAPTNEATVQINGGAAIAGTPSGSAVTFPLAAIPLGAAVTFQVNNIRVNATTATSPQVNMTGVISYAAAVGTSNASISAVPNQVGYVTPSLGSTAMTAAGAKGYTACAGNVVSATTSAPITNSFTLAISELAPGGFFKNAGVAPLGEGGYFQTGGGAGVATTATQIQVSIGNLPAGATVYLGGSASTAPGANTTVLTAVGAPIGGAGSLSTYVAVTPVSGVATAIYVASSTGTGAAGAQTFNIPVLVSFPANATAQTPITALVTYSPTGALTGPASAIPTFAASTATPLPTSAITSCATTLLFPYVTNASGFETGIAVSNTTTDNLKLLPVPGSAATPTTGTCTLNFYGNAAQPTLTTTPTLGAYTAAAPTVVPVYANTLTAMVGSSGFTGYAIASCTFLDAHGFAFITDASGTFSGAMGYLATVIPANRTENADSSSGTTLTLNTAGLVINTVGAVGTATGTITGSITAPTLGGFVGQ